MNAMTRSLPVALGRQLVLAIGLSVAATPALAQHTDHSKMDHSKVPKPAAEAPAKKPTVVDHAAMGHPVPPEAPVDHSAMGHETRAPGEPREPVPELTDADREAAFPDVHGHAAHDRGTHSYWLLDKLETWDADDGSTIAWEALGWVGGDIHRVWLRSEGEAISGSPESADVELLYGRSLSPWWDLVAGVRHDFGEGPSQSFAAVGLMGLSPYKFEVNATAYIGQSGQTAMRLEAEYDTLLTNRLILQWQAGAELFGQDDQVRGIGSGLSTLEGGLRLRYEITRKFAPYVGVTWERAYGQTAELRNIQLEETSDTRFVAGVRVWF